MYAKGNDLFYRCHNCGVGTNVANFLKHVDPSIHGEYVLERYKEGTAANTTNTYHTKSSSSPGVYIKPPKFDRVQKRSVFEHATWASDLPSGHFCLNYIENRLIPKEHYNKLLFTSNYKAFCDALIPEHGKELVEDARLVIPFYNEYDELVAVSGRALETSDYKLRYVTLRTNDNEDKLIYGMERVNLNKKVYLVEGPIDSLFLDNCVASGDANLGLTARELFKMGAKSITLVPDREPRNREIVKLINKFVQDGFDVCLLPDTIDGKDINEIVLEGIEPNNLQTIIDEHTFSGVNLHLEFMMWKKI